MERVQSELHAALLASVESPLWDCLASQTLASLVVPRETAAALEAQLAALRREVEAERERTTELQQKNAASCTLLDKERADLAAVQAEADCKQGRLDRIAAKIEHAQALYDALTTPDDPRAVHIMLQACAAVRNMATGCAEDPVRARTGAESGGQSTSQRVQRPLGTEADEGQQQPSASFWDQQASMALDCDTALPFCPNFLAMAPNAEERRAPHGKRVSHSRAHSVNKDADTRDQPRERGGSGNHHDEPRSSRTSAFPFQGGECEGGVPSDSARRGRDERSREGVREKRAESETASRDHGRSKERKPSRGDRGRSLSLSKKEKNPRTSKNPAEISQNGVRTPPRSSLSPHSTHNSSNSSSRSLAAVSSAIKADEGKGNQGKEEDAKRRRQQAGDGAEKQQQHGGLLNRHQTPAAGSSSRGRSSNSRSSGGSSRHAGTNSRSVGSSVFESSRHAQLSDAAATPATAEKAGHQMNDASAEGMNARGHKTGSKGGGGAECVQDTQVTQDEHAAARAASKLASIGDSGGGKRQCVKDSLEHTEHVAERGRSEEAGGERKWPVAARVAGSAARCMGGGVEGGDALMNDAVPSEEIIEETCMAPESMGESLILVPVPKMTHVSLREQVNR